MSRGCKRKRMQCSWRVVASSAAIKMRSRGAAGTKWSRQGALRKGNRINCVVAGIRSPGDPDGNTDNVALVSAAGANVSKTAGTARRPGDSWAKVRKKYGANEECKLRVRIPNK